MGGGLRGVAIASVCLRRRQGSSVTCTSTHVQRRAVLRRRLERDDRRSSPTRSAAYSFVSNVPRVPVPEVAVVNASRMTVPVSSRTSIETFASNTLAVPRSRIGLDTVSPGSGDSIRICGVCSSIATPPDRRIDDDALASDRRDRFALELEPDPLHAREAGQRRDDLRDPTEHRRASAPVVEGSAEIDGRDAASNVSPSSSVPARDRADETAGRSRRRSGLRAARRAPRARGRGSRGSRAGRARSCRRGGSRRWWTTSHPCRWATSHSSSPPHAAAERAPEDASTTIADPGLPSSESCPAVVRNSCCGVARERRERRPTTGANLKPWPEHADPTTTRPWRSRTNPSSAVFV